MGIIHVTDREGRNHAFEAVEGWSLMEILREYKTGIHGICGGAAECATCHVAVDEAWMPRLYPPREDELLKIDELPQPLPNSRLACQIVWEEALDGLKVAIPEEDA